MSAVGVLAPFAVGAPVRFTQQGRDEGKSGTIAGPVEEHPTLGYVMKVQWDDMAEPGVCPIRLLAFCATTGRGRFGA